MRGAFARWSLLKQLPHAVSPPGAQLAARYAVRAFDCRLPCVCINCSYSGHEQEQLGRLGMTHPLCLLRVPLSVQWAAGAGLGCNRR
jgi:hypothetical protein